MPAIAERLCSYLDEHRIAYQIVPDPVDEPRPPARPADSAQGDTPVTAWVLAIGERYAMLVLPADQPLAVNLLNEKNYGRRIRLASEAEIQHLFPDCEPTAIPPLGHLYGLPVYVGDVLASAATFLCQSGVGGVGLRLDRQTFERLIQPRWLKLPLAQPLELS